MSGTDRTRLPSAEAGPMAPSLAAAPASGDSAEARPQHHIPGTPVPVMSQFQAALIGALMVMLGPISLALYTPVMPALVGTFHTTTVTIKLTITVFFLGYAFSQLICGPLSDAFGRRPVALGFFGIFLAGSTMAMLAPTVTWLIAGRALQGVGCAAGIAISRAIVRDQYVGHASARIMNLIGIMLAIGPAISPTLGGLLFTFAGVNAIFIAMAVYGVLLVGLIVFVVPETNRSPDPALALPTGIVRSYRLLLGNRTFLRAALAVGCGLGGIYTLAAVLPFVLIDSLHLSPTGFGLAMMAQTGSFLLGSVVTSRLLKRMSAERLVPIGLGLVLVGGLGFRIGLHLVPFSVVSVMACVAVWASGLGLLLPGCTTSALSGFPQIAGAASALMGFMQIGGGLLGSAIAALLPTPFTGMTTILPAMAIVAAAGHLLLRPRKAELAAPAAAPSVDLAAAIDPVGIVGAGSEEAETDVEERKAG